MKFSLNPITAQKITNFQNTVRRLKIILLSLFFLLIIRASIWNPHGKNLADPRYDQKDDHIAKYCHKPSQSSYSLRSFMSFIKPVFWNSYFKILAESHYQRNDDQFAKYCQTPRNHRFRELFCCWSLARHFGALTVKFAPNPILAQNMANLQTTVTGLLFTVFRWSIFAYYVPNILEFLLWNFYLTKLRLIIWPFWKILSHAL